MIELRASRTAGSGSATSARSNPTYPHSIADHLSDPDVAGPIGGVLAHG